MCAGHSAAVRGGMLLRKKINRSSHYKVHVPAAFEIGRPEKKRERVWT
jgi:hypothetical protein